MQPIRIIIAGAGGGRGAWFVGEVAKNPQFQITALVEGIPATAEVAARQADIPDVRVFEDTREALGKVDCDALLVALPDRDHVEPVLAALELGKHVYVEKPLAISTRDCLKIVEADREAGGKTLVGFNLRFAPFYTSVHEAIRAGEIGDVLTIQADEFYVGGNTYFRRWNRLRKFGGGLWITKASHDFDLLYWMAGKLPSRVTALAELSYYVPKPEAGERCRECPIESECLDSALKGWETFPDSFKEILVLREAAGWQWDLCLFNSDKDTFDHGQAIVEFEGAVLGCYTVNVVSSISDRRMRVSGTEGMCEGNLRAGDMTLWKRCGDEPEKRVLVEGDVAGHGGGDELIMDNFAAFVRGEPARVTSPAEASVAIAIGEAATMASDNRRVVEMREVPRWMECARLLADEMDR